MRLEMRDARDIRTAVEGVALASYGNALSARDSNGGGPRREPFFLSAPMSSSTTQKEPRQLHGRGPDDGNAERGLPPLVLLADDEMGTVRIVEAELTTQGFRVLTAERGRDALRLASERHPAIMVLGVRLPDSSGVDVMNEVHHRLNLPVILISRQDDRDEKIRALNMGADDFVVKPFSPEELSARVRAVLRRTATQKPGRVVQMDGVTVDLERHTVSRQGRPVKLTRTEWMLLEHLIANSGHVLMNRDLLHKVWGPEYTNDLQYLRVWISRLRRKLELDPARPRFIRTYAGIGYMLDLRGGAAEAG